MDAFTLRDKKGRPVFIQQEGNLTKPTVRLTPTSFQWVKLLAMTADISMGSVVEQCVSYAIQHMAALEEDVGGDNT